MADEGRSSKAQPTRNTVQYLIVVARDQTALWQHMTRHYGEFKGVRVVHDRRQRERRQQVQTYEPERRRTERRRLPTIDDDLRNQPFVIIPQQQGALEG